MGCPAWTLTALWGVERNVWGGLFCTRFFSIWPHCMIFKKLSEIFSWQMSQYTNSQIFLHPKQRYSCIKFEVLTKWVSWRRCSSGKRKCLPVNQIVTRPLRQAFLVTYSLLYRFNLACNESYWWWRWKCGRCFLHFAKYFDHLSTAFCPQFPNFIPTVILPHVS